MQQPLRITSAENPRIKAVVKLSQQQRQRREANLFIAEGTRQLARAIASGLSVHEVFLCPELLSRHPGTADEQAALKNLQTRGTSQTGEGPHRTAEPVRFFEVTPQLMAKMAYRENPEGVLALVQPPVRTLQDFSRELSAQSSPALLLIAVGTTKPGNLGAMVRSADAAGALGVLVADTVVDPFHPNAIHASTAAVFTLPVVCESSSDIRALLAQHKIALLAATPEGDADYTDIDMTRPTALVIGTEHAGLDDAWLSAARAPTGSKIRIPMRSSASTDSLNASTAAAVLLFEALRQRRIKR